MNSLHILLLILATWRLANLLANEDGPFHMFKTLRSKIGRAEARSRLNERKGMTGHKTLLAKLHLYEGVNCEYCNSVWFGSFFAIAYLLAPSVATALASPLALSTGAIIIKHFVYLFKSVDTRFDQQNQAYLEAKAELAKRLNGHGHTVAPRPGTPEWDALVFDQNLVERR